MNEKAHKDLALEVVKLQKEIHEIKKELLRLRFALTVIFFILSITISLSILLR